MRYLSTLRFLLVTLWLYFGICNLVCAQDNNKLVSLNKKIMGARNNKALYLAFEELTDLYLSENRYNEYREFLTSLAKKKNELAPVVNYYIALTRYHQLKYLEDVQKWDEYFNQGSAYREEIAASLEEAINRLLPSDPFLLYAKTILWKFHRDQQGSLSEPFLSELIEATLSYAADAEDAAPIKNIANQLLSSGEKARAKQMYKVYLDKIIASDIQEEEIKIIAFNFYKEGNIDLAENVYDLYLEKIKEVAQERLVPISMEIAKMFSCSARGDGEEGIKDPIYAEKLFAKIEAVGGKEIFDEELIYMRAFNLEKTKEYSQAKDWYNELSLRYPQSVYADESDFKVGIIYTYILRDKQSGSTYFEKLSQKEIPNPQVISSLYQLGLLKQWEEDLVSAKEFYHRLLEKAKDNFQESSALARERLKEIEEVRPIEYNLKMFLDVSLGEENAIFDMTKLSLSYYPHKIKKEKEISINSVTYAVDTGCIPIELRYLWSGHLGKNKPANDQTAFVTQYVHPGTKEINLVVVSPTGVIDRNIELADVVE